jgi:sulfur-oxidizing protein SoxA
LIAFQSRGLPIVIAAEDKLRPFIEAGEALFGRRQGQLDIACKQCHEDKWDRRLGGNPITQAHPTAYPVYRLEWQSLASLQRRLRACMASLRAQPYDYGSEELVNLELYLMWRARGMNMESPGVRP